MNDSLPVIPGVSPETINEFLIKAGGRLEATIPQATIIEHKGRCIRVRRAGIQRSWCYLAEALIGPCGPCEEFRVDGFEITARLKTDAQREADNLAFDFDEQNGTLKNAWISFADLEPDTISTTQDTPRNSKTGRPRGKKTKRQMETGTRGDVLRLIAELSPSSPLDRQTLIDEVKSRTPTRLDSRGQDRRADYISRALRALIDDGVVYECANDCVSLQPDECDA